MKAPTIASSSTRRTRPASGAAGDARAAGAAAPRRASLASGGSSTEKRVPPPSRSSSSRWPPWSWTMPWTIARPMPEPRPTSLVVKNGSKMRARTGGGMPAPLSATERTTQWPCTGDRHDAQTPADRRGAEADRHGACAGDGVAGVDAQVEEHLLDLDRVAAHRAASARRARCCSRTELGRVERSSCADWPQLVGQRRARRSLRWRRANASICAIRSRARWRRCAPARAGARSSPRRSRRRARRRGRRSR